MFLPVRVLVTGGRDYDDAEYVFHVLDRWHKERGIECIIEGGASGADSFAATWARRNDVTLLTFPAEWQIGKAAGMIRNAKMLVEGRPNVVLAFPGGNGTQNMIDIAHKQGVVVIQPRQEWQDVTQQPESDADQN